MKLVYLIGTEEGGIPYTLPISSKCFKECLQTQVN